MLSFYFTSLNPVSFKTSLLSLSQFFSRRIHLFITGSVPRKMCSSRLVNCASEALKRANIEISHTGIKKLAGLVAVTVHLTATA